MTLQTQRLYRLMQRASRSWQRHESEMVACGGLTAVECQLMNWLAEHPNGTLEGLCDELEVTRSRLTRILDSVENKGLLARVADSADRRARRLTLTPAGRKSIETAKSSRARQMDALLEELSAKDLQALTRGLEAFLSTVENKKESSV